MTPPGSDIGQMHIAVLVLGLAIDAIECCGSLLRNRRWQGQVVLTPTDSPVECRAKVEILPKVHRQAIIVLQIRKKIASRLKAMITDAELPINQKNRPQYRSPSYAFFLRGTNHSDGLAIEDGERRFDVIESEREPPQQDFFIRLNAVSTGGRDTML